MTSTTNQAAVAELAIREELPMAAVLSERALQRLAEGKAHCVHAYAKVVDEDDVQLVSLSDANAQISTLLAQLEEQRAVSARMEADAGRARDMAMLVKQLAHRLKQADAACELPAKAIDYLQRHGLVGSPLRDGATIQQSLTVANLPPHPEPHTHTWTEMEKRCILAWGAELVQAADKAATERAAKIADEKATRINSVWIAQDIARAIREAHADQA